MTADYVNIKHFPFEGKTIDAIRGANEGSDCIVFIFSDNTTATFYHEQECCEDVAVDDVCGDIDDLLYTPLIVAEEIGVVNGEDKPRSEYDKSFKWTFYHFATIKGDVTIKWYGTSNGYYSEGVTVLYQGERRNYES